MIKIGSFFRNSVVERLKKDIGSANSLFVVQYSGLSSAQMTLLRNTLRLNQSQLLVTKNTLIRRALTDSQREGLDALIDGPIGLVFGHSDIAHTSKVLTKYAKENQNLILKGGFFRNRIFNKKDIEDIAELPSCEVLRAQLVSALMSPLAGLVYTLKGNLNKLVIVLNQIKEKR